MRLRERLPHIRLLIMVVRRVFPLILLSELGFLVAIGRCRNPIPIFRGTHLVQYWLRYCRNILRLWHDYLRI